jgi:hypothetical protein
MPEMFDRIVPTSIICILIYFVTKINGPRALKCINYLPLGKHFICALTEIIILTI